MSLTMVAFPHGIDYPNNAQSVSILKEGVSIRFSLPCEITYFQHYRKKSQGEGKAITKTQKIHGGNRSKKIIKLDVIISDSDSDLCHCWKV